MVSRFLIMVIYSGIAVSGALANESACLATEPKSFSKRIASASIFKNTIGSSDSLKTVTASLLSGALKKAEAVKPSDFSCVGACSRGPLPRVNMESVPRKRLGGENPDSYCQAKEKMDQKSPFLVPRQAFESLESVYDWISGFTQGKGVWGERLYKHCDSDCSPGYEFSLTKTEEDGYLLSAIAICGLPRDKSDNQYAVSANYLWTCQVAGPDSTSLETPSQPSGSPREPEK